jgi:ankyrin repeat protein
MQAGNTALHLAAARGQAQVVRELLCAGTDASILNQVPAAHSLLAAHASQTALSARGAWMQGCGVLLIDSSSESIHQVYKGRSSVWCPLHCIRSKMAGSVCISRPAVWRVY